MTRAVIALGGNAIQPKDSTGTIDEMRDAIRDTIQHIEPILSDYEVALTHGNGPQVGTLLLQQDDATAMPLDVLVAETQAQIGYLLQQAIRNHADRAAATVITQVRVDPNDPAFEEPTKPIGPYYTEVEAKKQDFPTMTVDDSDTPYRRVVASPTPQQVLEAYQIEQVLEDGTIPVCVGGGGIPVTRSTDGLQGTEAVIDKDAASELLARELNAERLIILTNVEHAYLHYGTDDQEPVTDVNADELEQFLEDDSFRTGSMRPKIEACINFIRSGGKEAIITTPEHLEAALNGETGTRVHA